MCLSFSEFCKHLDNMPAFDLALIQRRVIMTKNGVFPQSHWAYGASYLTVAAKDRTFSEFETDWNKWRAIRRLAGERHDFPKVMTFSDLTEIPVAARYSTECILVDGQEMEIRYGLWSGNFMCIWRYTNDQKSKGYVYKRRSDFPALD